MSNDDDDIRDADHAFRTQRMQTLSGLSPAFAPGEFVHLQHPVPGFADGTRFKVIASQGIGPGKFRYELLAGEKSIWIAENDLRPAGPEPVPPPRPGSPADPLANSGPNRTFSMTQRMQTMTLSQRMDLLGVVGGDDADLKAPNAPPPAPPPVERRRAKLTPEERLRQAASTPEPDGPVTGAPPYSDPKAPK
jgi:hypothetical protein